MADREESSESVVSPEMLEPDHNETNSATPGGGTTTETFVAAAAPPSNRQQQRRRRARTTGDAAGTSGDAGRQRRRVSTELINVPNFEPVCYVCSRSFGSWKALFGHLRAHPRATPGAFPPPTFKADGFPRPTLTEAVPAELRQQMAPTLLGLAQQTMQILREQGGSSSNPPTASRVVPYHPPATPPPPPPPPPPPARNVHGFDLNLPPPPEEGDGDGGDGNMDE